MASRHARFAPVAEYQTQHVTSTGTNVPIGPNVATTTPTTIVASTMAVTPASMSGIVPGTILNLNGGTGAAEDVVVLSITSTTFTATFVNGHSGAYTISSHKGVFLGPIIIGNPGTSMVLTLFNGHPNASPAGVTIAVITISASATSYPFAASLDQGGYYTLAGTPGDITIQYLAHSS